MYAHHVPRLLVTCANRKFFQCDFWYWRVAFSVCRRTTWRRGRYTSAGVPLYALTHLFVSMGRLADNIFVVVSTLSTVAVQLLVETSLEEGRIDFHLFVTMYVLYFII